MEPIKCHSSLRAI